MRPGGDQVLRTLSAQLLVDVAPHVAVPYGRASAETMAVLLVQAAEEYDRAAEVRVEENRAMREIFRDAAARVTDEGLRRRLEDAAAGTEASLRVSALDEANDRLRRLLIELHAFVEERSEPWARCV
ncbi:MAG: hypothetical protein ACREQ9_18500, partial [Candidatus Binatia bacterium]